MLRQPEVTTHVALSSLCLIQHLFPLLVHQLLGDLLEGEEEHLLFLGLVRSEDDRLLAALDLNGVLQVCGRAIRSR